MQQPEQEQFISGIASALGISKITFQRQFQQQSGMNFGKWRQQARLLLALQKLAQGEKIVSVALSVGYSSQSAFSARFKQFFGQCLPASIKALKTEMQRFYEVAWLNPVLQLKQRNFHPYL